jgi:hypothetical protein
MKGELSPETTIGVKEETIDFKAATTDFVKQTENLPPEEMIDFKAKTGLVRKTNPSLGLMTDCPK